MKRSRFPDRIAHRCGTEMRGFNAPLTGICLRPQANNGMLDNGGQPLAIRAVVCFQKCRAHWSILLTLERVVVRFAARRAWLLRGGSGQEVGGAAIGGQRW
jgi:hypothetical protein